MLRVFAFARRWWAAPNSIIGHALGAMYRCEHCRIHGGITEYYDNSRLRDLGIAAIVFGNTINYGVGVNPSCIVPRYDRLGFVVLRDHEVAHVTQYRVLGPFFLPAYLLCEGWARISRSINAFENAADNACDPQQATRAS